MKIYIIKEKCVHMCTVYSIQDPIHLYFLRDPIRRGQIHLWPFFRWDPTDILSTQGTNRETLPAKGALKAISTNLDNHKESQWKWFLCVMSQLLWAVHYNHYESLDNMICPPIFLIIGRKTATSHLSLQRDTRLQKPSQHDTMEKWPSKILLNTLLSFL